MIMIDLWINFKTGMVALKEHCLTCLEECLWTSAVD